jgi:hypothetical protein
MAFFTSSPIFISSSRINNSQFTVCLWFISRFLNGYFY